MAGDYISGKVTAEVTGNVQLGLPTGATEKKGSMLCSFSTGEAQDIYTVTTAKNLKITSLCISSATAFTIEVGDNNANGPSPDEFHNDVIASLLSSTSGNSVSLTFNPPATITTKLTAKTSAGGTASVSFTGYEVDE